MDSTLLDWALASFSGSVAAEERSAGPDCVRAVVDHRQDTRMLSAVRDHDPHHDDIAALLRRVQTALAQRDLARKGITADGSARSPAPLRTVCGQVPHPRCPFHGIKELTQGVVQAGAKARDRVATSTRTVKRGRPSSTDKAARRVARTNKTLQQKISDVFQDRLVFVKRRLTRAARHRYLPITRGFPQWRTVRESMEPLSALCDRRGPTQTALGTLKKVRQGGSRFTWLGET